MGWGQVLINFWAFTGGAYSNKYSMQIITVQLPFLYRLNTVCIVNLLKKAIKQTRGRMLVN